jgi:hypothetical protein
VGGEWRIEGSFGIGRGRRCRLEEDRMWKRHEYDIGIRNFVLCITLSPAHSFLMTIKYILCTDISMSHSLDLASLLLVQLIRALLEFLLAGRLAKVVGDDRARVGLVGKRGGAAAGGVGVFVVKRVGRCSRVLGLLRDLVGDAYSNSQLCFLLACWSARELLLVALTASGLFFFGVDGHGDGFGLGDGSMWCW